MMKMLNGLENDVVNFNINKIRYYEKNFYSFIVC